MGKRAFERGDDDVALENLARLAQHGHHYADVFYMIGMIQERQGNLDAAFEGLRKATRINPSYVEALIGLASLHEQRGDYDLSRSYAERASQLSRPAADGLDPTTRGKLANQQAELADALAQVGEKRDAIEQYRSALDRCPNFHDIRFRLGVTLREAGLPYQASQEFRRVLDAHPGLLESQIQLGLTYYSLGRTPEAIAEWEAVLERDPSRDEARMYLRLVRGTVAQPDNRASFYEPEHRPEHTPERPPPSTESPAGWATRPLDGARETPAEGGAARTASPPRDEDDGLIDIDAPDTSWETFAERVFSNAPPSLDDLDFDADENDPDA